MLGRTRGPRPKLFNDPSFQEVVDEFAKYKLGGGVRKTQLRFDFETRLIEIGLWEEVQAALRKEFLGKCAFTEVSSDDATLTLYRPREDARDYEGTVDELHYWWLLPSWQNWYLGIVDNESYRGTTFPVVGERSKAPTKWPARPRLDKGVLLDPCNDLPMFHLGFELDGSVVPREHPSPSVRADYDNLNRGEISIDTYGLFAPQLVRSRQGSIDHALERLEHLINGPTYYEAPPPGTPRADPDFYYEEPEPGTREDWAEDLVDVEQEHAGCVRQIVAGELVRRIVNDGLISPKSKSGWGPSYLTDLCFDLSAELAAHCLNDPDFRRPKHGDAFWDHIAKDLTDTFPDVEGTDDYRRAFVRRSRARKQATKQAKAAAPVEPLTVWSHSQLTYVKIKNFKSIHELELDLTKLVDEEEAESPAPTVGLAPWAALLGENGSGKSSILQAIALALSADRLGEVTGAGATEGEHSGDAETTPPAVVWGDVLRRVRPGDEPYSQGRVVLQFGPTTEVDFRFNEDRCWYHGLAGQPVKTPIVHMTVRGYGAIRLFGNQARQAEQTPEVDPDTHRSNVAIANMFDPTVPVVDARKWLLNLGKGLNDDEEAERLFNTAALTISDLLRAGDDTLPKDQVLLERKEADVWVDGVRLRDLSDGYRAVVSLAADIMAAVGPDLSDLRNATGLVLVDELGAHLHPRWRMRITAALRQALPNMQFIVSTHEPLCLRGLRAGEVVRVWRNAERNTAAEQIDRSPAKFRVDQLLTSEFFGLDTAIDPDIDRQYQDYYELLRFQAKMREEGVVLDDAEQKRLAELVQSQTLDDAVEAMRQQVLVKARPVLGFTRRDQLMYEAIDDYLKDGLDPRDNRARRKAALERVASIWHDVGGRRGLLSQEPAE